MNLYFAGSIRGGRDDAAFYHDIIACLGAWGTVLTEHVGDPALTDQGDDGPDDAFIYHRDMDWLGRSRAVIAEVTQPSLGVGFELGTAVALGKPILALYRPSSVRPLSAMIGGCPDIDVVPYLSLDEASEAIRRFLSDLVAKEKSHDR
jgi:nucleoside 2-deoxyribosyltransferase